MTKRNTRPPRQAHAPARPALAGALLLAALACHEDDSQGPTGYLSVDNRSSAYIVNSVYIANAPAGSSWGMDRLTTDVGPGERQTLDFPADTYDIRIDSDHPRAPLYIWGIAVAEDALVAVTVTDADMTWDY